MKPERLTDTLFPHGTNAIQEDEVTPFNWDFITDNLTMVAVLGAIIFFFAVVGGGM